MDLEVGASSLSKKRTLVLAFVAVLVVGACNGVAGSSDDLLGQTPVTTSTTVNPMAETSVATSTAQTLSNPRMGRPAYDDFVLLTTLDAEIGYVCEWEYASDLAACYDAYERGTPGFQSVVEDNVDYYLGELAGISPNSGTANEPGYQSSYEPDYEVSDSFDSSDIGVYAPGASCTEYGSSVYCSDGTSYSQFGNTVYGSDGSSCTEYGSSVYCSDGTSYSQFGNTVYGSDGTSYTRFGDTVYGSDGSSCSEYGNTVYCSP